MDEKTLLKLAVLAKKDPKLASELEKQAAVISDDELENVAGGYDCVFTSTCIFDSDCWTESPTTGYGYFERCETDSKTADGKKTERRGSIHIL